MVLLCEIDLVKKIDVKGMGFLGLDNRRLLRLRLELT